jgi:mannitol/fructose-specific phosphotransferase system IIA component (Ntr-type)
MKLAKALARETIIAELSSHDRRGAFGEMTRRLVAAGAFSGTEDLVGRLEEREALESTGIGSGVAIPHARTKAVSRVVLGVARSRAGLDFQAGDGVPVHLIFLLVSPESAAGEHLAALARISRLVRHRDFCRELLAASGSEEMLDVIVREDGKH